MGTQKVARSFEDAFRPLVSPHDPLLLYYIEAREFHIHTYTQAQKEHICRQLSRSVVSLPYPSKQRPDRKMTIHSPSPTLPVDTPGYYKQQASMEDTIPVERPRVTLVSHLITCSTHWSGGSSVG